MATSNNESSISSQEKRDWISLINESVHTNDDVDIGDIDVVSRNFIVVKRGFVNVHYYYIPVTRVEGWDGDVLWLKVTENEVKEIYERNIIPDPNQYFIKDYPYYTARDNYPFFTTGYYYPLHVIARRYVDPYSNITKSPPEENGPRIYKCDLCEEEFKSEDELDKHMDSARH